MESRIINPKDGKEMILIPDGEFLMGSNCQVQRHRTRFFDFGNLDKCSDIVHILRRR